MKSDPAASLPPAATLLPTWEEHHARLRVIFDPHLTGDGRLCSPLAAKAVQVMRFVGAESPARAVRPSTVLWANADLLSVRTDAVRNGYYSAALRGKRAVADLAAQLRVGSYAPWHADTTREPLRDETWAGWAVHGAIVRDPDVPTTSPKPQWWLTPDFSALFDATLTGAKLERAIVAFQDENLPREARAARAIENELAKRAKGIEVVVNGETQKLAPGEASAVLKGVVETLAPKIMRDPWVLAISEPGNKLRFADAEMLALAGLEIDVARLLPDALLFDKAKGSRGLVFVEVAFSDGPIHELRRRRFLEWAEGFGYKSDSCRFVTAFTSRASDAFRRALPVLSWDTLVWCLSSPDHIIRLEHLGGSGS